MPFEKAEIHHKRMIHTDSFSCVLQMPYISIIYISAQRSTISGSN